ncbi:uncharacterized protein BJ171DRAFT_144189 [Polychytrium aggregatum]|uniref:uncharacterized protein n=1 Tax=Polychytrium aggregatum TaxID=110093 RepID=UPI0022FE8743|nr:uncharacterized protein BJ171DRAFT_144189 [Polychytrium aggregatum]KAI9203453.1 hypothetical protein BJ171DRAFT_144189 [Polychytrium aggregatum]
MAYNAGRGVSLHTSSLPQRPYSAMDRSSAYRPANFHPIDRPQSPYNHLPGGVPSRLDFDQRRPLADSTDYYRSSPAPASLHPSIYDRERQIERELQLEREKNLELERMRDMELLRIRELERDKERERDRERLRLLELEKERQRERYGPAAYGSDSLRPAAPYSIGHDATNGASSFGYKKPDLRSFDRRSDYDKPRYPGSSYAGSETGYNYARSERDDVRSEYSSYSSAMPAGIGRDAVGLSPKSTYGDDARSVSSQYSERRVSKPSYSAYGYPDDAGRYRSNRDSLPLGATANDYRPSGSLTKVAESYPETPDYGRRPGAPYKHDPRATGAGLDSSRPLYDSAAATAARPPIGSAVSQFEKQLHQELSSQDSLSRPPLLSGPDLKPGHQPRYLNFASSGSGAPSAALPLNDTSGYMAGKPSMQSLPPRPVSSQGVRRPTTPSSRQALAAALPRAMTPSLGYNLRPHAASGSVLAEAGSFASLNIGETTETSGSDKASVSSAQAKKDTQPSAQLHPSLPSSLSHHSRFIKTFLGSTEEVSSSNVSVVSGQTLSDATVASRDGSVSQPALSGLQSTPAMTTSFQVESKATLPPTATTPKPDQTLLRSTEQGTEEERAAETPKLMSQANAATTQPQSAYHSTAASVTPGVSASASASATTTTAAAPASTPLIRAIGLPSSSPTETTSPRQHYDYVSRNLSNLLSITGDINDILKLHENDGIPASECGLLKNMCDVQLGTLNMLVRVTEQYRRNVVQGQQGH